MKIPFVRLYFDNEQKVLLSKVLNSGWITRGPMREIFESKIHSIYNTPAVTFSSGTSAIFSALHALREGGGGEVLIPTLTFVSDATASLLNGFNVRFVDINPDTLTIDPYDLEEKITNQSRIIIPVHYAGQNCDIDYILEIAEKYDLHVIEDACHSFAVKYKGNFLGTCGDIGVFSFHATKQIAIGEGGACITNNLDLKNSLLSIRNNGIVYPQDKCKPWFYDVIQLGLNFHLNELSCALGLYQTDNIKEINRKRRLIARRYKKLGKLNGISCLKEVNKNHSYM